MWYLLSWLDRLHMKRQGGAYLNTLILHGTYRCKHRSHILRLRCYRHWAQDGFCGKHLNSCYSGCAI